MKLKLLLILLLAQVPLFSYAQKAFEFEYYRGMVQGKTVKLNLANGYIGATKITIAGKPLLTFHPESGTADQPFILRCAAKNHSEYFALNHIQDTYADLPKSITGKYISGKTVLLVMFYRIKN